MSGWRGNAGDAITSGTTATNITGLIRGVGGVTVNVPMIDAANYTLMDSNGGFSVGWNIRTLDRSSGDAVLDWENSSLYNNVGLNILNWQSAVAGTLTALAGVTFSANTLTIGTGAGTVGQTAFAANTFPARASTGNLVAKTVTDAALGLLDDSTVADMRTTLQVTEPTAALVGSYDDINFNAFGTGRWMRGGWQVGNGGITSDNLIVTNHIGTGTLTTVDSTITNYRTMMKRNVLTSAASAGSIAHVRTASYGSSVVRGNASNIGGFFYKYTYAVETSVASSRQFVGLRNLTTTPTTGTEPSTLVNCIILGWDSGDTNLQIMHNDASGTCTKIDLGASFPANTANTVYTLYLFSEPNGSAIYYEVRRRDSAAVASGTISTDLPANTVFMVTHHWGDNGPTAAAIPLNIIKLDIWWKMH